MKVLNIIKRWLLGAARVAAREIKLITSDTGVMIFFLGLPLLYPLIYTLIYNPEVARDLPVVVVDECRTAQTRGITRMADATEAINIVGYASSMADARRLMASKECYGILQFPADFSRRIGRGQQGVAVFYSEMSLLLRYRAFAGALTSLQIECGATIRRETLDAAGAAMAPQGMMSTATVNNESYFIGDPTQGFASFVMPGILVLILQQSMVLGVAMLGGGRAERRRRGGGLDPMAVNAGPLATIIGRLTVYLLIYAPLTVYLLHYVPLMFSLPHYGSAVDYLLLALPLLTASALMGMAIEPLISERESSMLVIVVTSVIFLFLSGLTWPRYAMPAVWQALGNCVPATWGIQGFIAINSNGATLAQAGGPYRMLWLCTAVYLVAAWAVNARRRR